jgi:hypothetical protein
MLRVSGLRVSGFSFQASRFMLRVSGCAFQAARFSVSGGYWLKINYSLFTIRFSLSLRSAKGGEATLFTFHSSS